MSRPRGRGGVAGRARAASIALAFTLAGSALLASGCEELGNPLPGTGRAVGPGQLVRENDSAVGKLVIEARYVAPEQVHDLLAALGDEVDYVDRTRHPHGAIVVVMVRPEAPERLPPRLHLVSDFRYASGATERRVWMARTERARFIAVFGLRGIPTDVHTTTL